jgi:site-specific recombinase XerD
MDLFDQFLQERMYLKNVSPETLRYYKCVHRAFQPILSEPNKAGMIECIQKLLAGGISPASVNTYLRGFKAYFRWLQAEGHTKETFKVQFLKTEARVLATLSTEQIKRLLDLRPKGRNETRAHIVALLILDGGYRISEVLGLVHEHCDFDNLMVKVRDKGNKHRLVPLSMEMRRRLYRYAAKHSAPIHYSIVSSEIWPADLFVISVLPKSLLTGCATLNACAVHFFPMC